MNDVGSFEHFVELVRNGHAKLFELARNQRARTDKRHLRAEFEQTEDIGARDTAKKNVADNHDLKSRDPALSRPDRVEIEQRLRGMLVGAIARVDDARLETFGEELRCARRTMPEDDEIRVIGLEDFRRVLERFALNQT